MRVLLLLLAAVSAQTAQTAPPAPTVDGFTKVLLTEYAAGGAVCLDGSPAPLYLRPGTGDGLNQWLLYFEGGAWAESWESARKRSLTVLGSSRFNSTTYHSRDLMKSDCAVNPAFCTHTVVFAAYCDGASFAGDVSEPVDVDGTTVYVRGFRILNALLDAMLRPQGPGAGLPSLSQASSLLLTGSSAGGLAVYLHADYITDSVAAVNKACVVKAAPEVGFFIDGESIWEKPRIDVEVPSQRHVMTEVFTRIASLANITGGQPQQVNAACVAATPAAQRWKCFSAQYTLPYIRTPFFVINSMHDEWQAQHILAPDLDISVSVSVYPGFADCILAPQSGCNATQAAQWTGYAAQFLGALESARALTPPELAAGHGGVITSCPIHTTMLNGFSRRILVGGVSLYDALVAWLEGKPGSAGSWAVDVDYPENESCPRPSKALDDI